MLNKIKNKNPKFQSRKKNLNFLIKTQNIFALIIT
jgi:hypothetical protein